MAQTRLVQGNEAVARAAIAAGCTFYGGYPITPSSEIAEHMVRLLPAVNGTFVQMEDEIASLASVVGASLGGAKAMTATSGPGFSLMQEHIGYATMAEVPCVVVNVMRGGPSTGLPTSPSQGDVMQARWGTHGDHPAIVLAPSSVSEVFDVTVRAFNLAERFRTIVTIVFDEIIAHTRESATFPDTVEVVNRAFPSVGPDEFMSRAAPPDGTPPLPAFGDGYRFHVTGLAYDERGFPTNDAEVAGALIERLHRKIEGHLDEIIEVETHLLDDAEIAVFAYGITGRSAKEAVNRAREAGVKAGLIRPITIWPFPDAHVAEVASRVDTILVAEMNRGQLIHEVQRAALGQAEIIGHHRADGEPITPSELFETLMSAAGGRS